MLQDVIGTFHVSSALLIGASIQRKAQTLFKFLELPPAAVVAFRPWATILHSALTGSVLFFSGVHLQVSDRKTNTC